MKRFLPVITVLVFYCTAHAQQYNKYIIQFTDKNNSPYSIANPSSYLSAKAIARRAKHNIPVDSTDLPVNPAYIQQVLAKSTATLLVQSRWLNDILIYTTNPADIDSINTLPVVKKANPVGFLIHHSNGTVRDKFAGETVQEQEPAAVHGITGDTLQYGTNYAQVHIHNGEFLHNKGYTGKGMVIAVLDAGFYHYTTLAAFDSIRLNNQVLGVKDFVAYDNSVIEDNTHGMECLSTIAANIPGVMVGTAPKASFWLLRSENAATEYPIEEHNWVAAAEYADSAGADMISSSLGYNQFNDNQFNHTYADFYNNSAMVTKGAAFAAKKGMIVTNSAGNEGDNSWKYIVFPADADSVCAVGAVDAAGNIAGFSSYGYPGKVKPNIVSVGSATIVFSPNGVPVAGYGTSFSNPNINGLIACLWQAFPQYNNMAILDAVYKSADRYLNPDNRYGYGIPNMQQAYLMLKKKQNDSIYGGNWLIAMPNPFTDTIHVTLIGQSDGPITLTLKAPDGAIVSVINLTIQQQEIYDTTFTGIGNLLGGNYTITYNDGTTVKTVTIVKNGPRLTDWLQAIPTPFTTQLTVYIKAPETGSITLRLVDVNGKIVSTQQLAVSQNTVYQVHFAGASSLARAVYFIQYIGPKQKRTIKVLKG